MALNRLSQYGQHYQKVTDAVTLQNLTVPIEFATEGETDKGKPRHLAVAESTRFDYYNWRNLLRQESPEEGARADGVEVKLLKEPEKTTLVFQSRDFSERAEAFTAALEQAQRKLAGTEADTE